VGVITAPLLLEASHDVSGFDSGSEVLNEWLQKRALKNQKGGGSRTFVICDGTQLTAKVIGYYALASGSVERLSAPKSVARNMPDPIPVIVLGRLAISESHQGGGLGAALLRDALLRVLNVTHNVGVRAVLVHAISDSARQFYLSYGFQPSPCDEMTLMLPVSHIESNL
jgi:GNAT superfamily N-acetyltransferase